MELPNLGQCGFGKNDNAFQVKNYFITDIYMCK